RAHPGSRPRSSAQRGARFGQRTPTCAPNSLGSSRAVGPRKPSSRWPPMLTAAFHILRDRVVYQDLGADHFTKRDPAKAAKRLVKRLEGLGYAVEARPTSALVSI